MNRANPRDLVITTVVCCLGLAAAGGFGGAVSCQVASRGDCSEAWKAGVSGALMAATTGGTLLAQLDRSRRPEDAADPLPRRPGEG